MKPLSVEELQHRVCDAAAEIYGNRSVRLACNHLDRAISRAGDSWSAQLAYLERRKMNSRTDAIALRMFAAVALLASKKCTAADLETMPWQALLAGGDS
jgi:hypothetical protein